MNIEWSRFIEPFVIITLCGIHVYLYINRYILRIHSISHNVFKCRKARKPIKAPIGTDRLRFNANPRSRRYPVDYRFHRVVEA